MKKFTREAIIYRSVLVTKGLSTSKQHSIVYWTTLAALFQHVFNDQNFSGLLIVSFIENKRKLFRYRSGLQAMLPAFHSKPSKFVSWHARSCFVITTL